MPEAAWEAERERSQVLVDEVEDWVDTLNEHGGADVEAVVDGVRRSVTWKLSADEIAVVRTMARYAIANEEVAA